MGSMCINSVSPKFVNSCLKKAIKEKKFLEINQILLLSKIGELDTDHLHEAVKSGNIDILNLLIEFGLNN